MLEDVLEGLDAWLLDSLPPVLKWYHMILITSIFYLARLMFGSYCTVPSIVICCISLFAYQRRKRLHSRNLNSAIKKGFNLNKKIREIKRPLPTAPTASEFEGMQSEFWHEDKTRLAQLSSSRRRHHVPYNNQRGKNREASIWRSCGPDNG
jgi:hypothetical protein